MAQRRMFSFRIVNSARFLQMPDSAQNLYFHLGMRADDDGIVEAYPVLKLLGTSEDNYKILIAKGFLVPLNEDQVTFITDWNEHNVIRADRKVDSVHKNLLLSKIPDAPVIEAKPRSDVEDNSRRTGGQSTDGIGKVRLGKDNSCETGVSQSFQEFLLVEGCVELEFPSNDGFMKKQWTKNGKPLSASMLASLTGKYNRQNGIKIEKADNDFDAVFQMFKFNSMWFRLIKIPAQRKAVEDLLKIRSIEQIQLAVDKSRKLRGKKFAPQINSPYDLSQKIDKVEQYKENSGEPISNASVASEIML